MNFALPSLDRRRDGLGLRPDRVLPFSSGLTLIAPLHHDLDGAANSDEEDRQSREPSRTVREDLPIVVSDVDDHVETGAAVSRDRVVERGEEDRDEGRELVARLTGTQTHARSV